MKLIASLLCLILFPGACQSATPLPITGDLSKEFTLAIGQAATIPGTGLTMTLLGITGDERCPGEIECALSGPVSLTISLQKDSDAPVEFALQTFTSSNGRVPDRSFEGMQDRIDDERYIIQVKSVLPYPIEAFGEIKQSEYQVSLLVTAK